MTAEPFLRLSRYSLESLRGEALAKVSLELCPGELTFLLGKNGSGKSTLLQLLYDFSVARVAKKSDTVFVPRRFCCAFLPQKIDREFFIPLSLSCVARLNPEFSEKRFERFSLLLPDNLGSKPWNESSGGERQRALLLQVLSSKADLYLLDEPFNHLEADFADRLFEIFQEELRELRKFSYFISTHSLPSRFKENSRVKKILLAQEGAYV